MKTPASNVTALRDRAELDEAIDILNDALSARPAAASPQVRTRLLGRIADSALRHRGLVTARTRRLPVETLADGVTLRTLYRTGGDGSTRVRRAGEPQRLLLLELQPGARLHGGLGLAHRHSEWLITAGSVTLDGVALDTHDHHGHAASTHEPLLASAGGCTIYLRDNGDEPSPAGTSRARQAQWENFAPGIRRRVLWQAGNACAYLARAQLGAAVPAHGHRNDEECFMLEGDIFTGDILVREGELQLAPAGLQHGLVQAATACLIYLRGDAELDILPG